MAHDLLRVNAEPNLLTRMARAWERFFFTPADPTPLAVIRIFGGLLILSVHLAYCFDLRTFFAADAMIDLATINDFRQNKPNVGHPFDWPAEFAKDEAPLTPEEVAYARKWDMNPYLLRKNLAAKGGWTWSLWYHVTDPTWIAILHGGILLVMACLTVGFCTRIAAVLSWLAILSYMNRMPTSLFGMDAIMSLVMLYIMIGPSGAVLSVDHWLARRRARRSGNVADPALAPTPAPLVSANLALRLFQVHLCIIYFASGSSKLQGHTWWLGTAVWGTMANYEFSPMYNPLYLESLRFLARRRWLWELFITGSTAFTLAFELGFPFLVWLRSWRWVMLAAAAGLHLGIAFFMGLVGFSAVMLVAVLSFIPAEAYHQGFAWARRKLLGPEETDGPAAVPVRLSRSA